MVHIEQLLGNWISKDKYPQHLGKDGFLMKFHFRPSPVDDVNIANVISISPKKQETVLFSGKVTLEAGVADEFFALIKSDEENRIPIRNYANDRFIADIPHYGLVTFYKEKVLGIRMSF